MAVDLHTHSVRSDGLLAPAELVRQAHAAGLVCVALTDHDSIAGVAEADTAAAALGVRLIPGIELSVRDAGGVDDHMLAWFVDPDAPALMAYLERLQAGREAMADATLDALGGLGLPVARARVLELAHGAVVTRPHIARAMVEAGHVATEQEAFERFLGWGKPAAVSRPAPDPATAIDVVRSAGGVAGLAHPVFPQDRDAADRLANLPTRLDALVGVGLRALECHYPDAKPELTERLLELAHERKLVPTGGSDYHGPGRAPFVPLGHSTVPISTVDALASTASAAHGWNAAGDRRTS